MNDELPGLIFDCDGVLADTERFGHLRAFNQTFEEFGLPVRWSETEYAEKLLIGGGKERLSSLLDDDFVARAGLPREVDGQQAQVRLWHARKTEIYTELVRAGALPGRPGIRRIVEDAIRAGWELAVASTSAEQSVRAVLEHAVGSANAAHFSVFAGDVVAHKKPAPDIYLQALHELGRTADGTVVVEDSRNGLVAAHAAGLACVVTVNGYTADEDFSEAALVVTSLGDADEPAEVIENRCGAVVLGVVTLDDLRAAMPTDRALHDRGEQPASPSQGR